MTPGSFSNFLVTVSVLQTHRSAISATEKNSFS